MELQVKIVMTEKHEATSGEVTWPLAAHLCVRNAKQRLDGGVDGALSMWRAGNWKAVEPRWLVQVGNREFIRAVVRHVCVKCP